MPHDEVDIETDKYKGAGLRLNVGVSGSGKTSNMNDQIFSFARQGMPIVYLDQLADMASCPSDITSALIEDLPGTKEEMDMTIRALAAPRRIVVCRPNDPYDYLMALCRYGVPRSKRNPNGRPWPGVMGIALPEAHLIVPNKKSLDPIVMKVVTQWRHHGLAVWFDTQRFSLLNTTAIHQSREIRLFAIVGDTDLKRVRDLGGDELSDLVREAGRRMQEVHEGGDNEPGWYVRLNPARLPPYKLVRDER